VSIRRPCGLRGIFLQWRTRLVRTRAENSSRLQNMLSQYNLPPIGNKLGFATAWARKSC
jgi:hypothetical protein